MCQKEGVSLNDEGSSQFNPNVNADAFSFPGTGGTDTAAGSGGGDTSTGSETNKSTKKGPKIEEVD